jgi:hypothetical protein
MEKIVVGILVALALALRLALAIVNQQSNDDHLEVSRLMLEGMQNTQMPENLKNCWECYHPKLFHFLCTISFKIFTISNPESQIQFANLINVVFGMLSVLLIVSFIYKIEPVPSQRLLIIALTVLNPRMVATDIQATNDTSVIFFGILSTYLVWLTWNENRPKILCLTSVSVVLALLTKGSGIILLSWLLILFVARATALSDYRQRIHQLSLPLLILVALLTLVSLLPQHFNPYPNYFANSLKRGALTAVNFEARPIPSFLERSYVGLPGVTSLFDSYFTFRIWNMLQEPVVTYDAAVYPLHRTSLWSQLYGRYNFSFFDQWPWQNTSFSVLALGRLLLLFGLIPTALMLLGWAIQIKTILNIRHNWRKVIICSSDWICLLQSFAFLLFIIVFTMDYRSFEAMKDIYLLPAFLSFVRAFQLGIKFAYGLIGNAILKKFCNAALWVLVILYITNSIILYAHITKLLTN